MFARLLMFSFMVFVAHSALATTDEDFNPYVIHDRYTTDKSLEIRGNSVRDLR